MLKKITLMLLVILLVSCQSSTVNSDEVNLQKYEAYYQSILDSDSFQEKSEYFSIEAVMNMVEGAYRFSVIIDEPLVAMYNIEMMAIIDDGSVSVNYDTVMPASGIFDRSYNMLPYQSNETSGFPSGIIVDGLCDNSRVTLLILVAWKNETSTESFRQFFRLVADVDTKVEVDKKEETDNTAETDNTVETDNKTNAQQ